MDFVPEGPGFKSNSALAFSSSFFILPLMSQKIWLEAREDPIILWVQVKVLIEEWESSPEKRLRQTRPNRVGCFAK